MIGQKSEKKRATSEEYLIIRRYVFAFSLAENRVFAMCSTPFTVPSFPRWKWQFSFSYFYKARRRTKLVAWMYIYMCVYIYIYFIYIYIYTCIFYIIYMCVCIICLYIRLSLPLFIASNSLLLLTLSFQPCVDFNFEKKKQSGSIASRDSPKRTRRMKENIEVRKKQRASRCTWWIGYSTSHFALLLLSCLIFL